LASATATVAARPSGAGALVPAPSLRERLATRSERSAYAEASCYADVQAFLAVLDERSAPVTRGVLAVTSGGREVPFVVASRPLVRTPSEAQALGRPIVYIQAGIHGGEVDGTEALLAMVRDFCLSTQKTLLEELVLVTVPLYNPDGTENAGAADVLRPYQAGPARVGTLENGSGVDLALDYVKAEAPETRGALAFVQAWRPDVFVDLRTYEDSFDTFSALFAPARHPAALFGARYARDRMLPAAAAELRAKFALATFVDGHFGRAQPLPVPPSGDATQDGWFADACYPRAGIDAMGLRGIAALRVAVNGHDAFEQRIYTTRACVETILGLCSDDADDIVALTRRMVHWSRGSVWIRAARDASPSMQAEIAWNDLVADPSGEEHAGIPPGYQYAGSDLSAVLPVYDRFVGTLTLGQPAGYLVPSMYVPLVRPLLATHGIAFEIQQGAQVRRVQRFVVDSFERAAEPVGGRRPVNLRGHWDPSEDYAAQSGALYVPTAQAAGPLVSVLLEPESEDGFYVWDVFGDAVRAAEAAPVLSVVAPLARA